MMFKNENEFFEALDLIQPCDLKDGKTSTKDAVKFCRQVLDCFYEARHFVPNKERLETKLVDLGACNYRSASETFKTSGKNTVGDAMKLKDNIEFPLLAFSQIIDTKPSSDSTAWEFNWGIMTDGNEYSWINQWLTSQQKNDEKIM